MLLDMPGCDAGLLEIVYIEDDPHVRAAACIVLEAIGGFKVRAYASGAEALADMSETHADLLLTDAVLPDSDGIATLAAIRARCEAASIAAVFLTGRVQAADVARYRQLGAIGVIAKPFEPMTLASKVRSIWEQREHAAP
jgi:CheY-like chemotaxis protein